MSRLSLRIRFAVTLGIPLLLCWSRPLLGQNAPAAETAPNPAADEKAAPLREQTIYIPYEKLRKVFEKEGRGVFLPYEKFRELWEAAREKTAQPPDERPPTGAVITETENEATVSKDVVRVVAKVKIDLLAEGWHKVPLRLADAAITEAKIGDQPARILGDGGAGYQLLIEKKGKQPESIVLDLQYAKAITRQPGQNSVDFQAPQAPVSRWRVRIPEPGVKVELSPLIAATEESRQGGPPPDGEAKAEEPKEGEPKEAAKPADETVVLAFVGAAPTVRIQWTPKAEGATGLEALVSVQTQQEVWIHEGVTRSRVQFTYSISRAELEQLAIELPGDYKVTNVFDANVRQWSVEQADNTQKLNVQFFEPAKGNQAVTVELEKFAGDEPQRSVAVPKALGVGRQQGLIVVQVAEGLRAEAAQTSGLQQVDAAELPQTLRQTAWNFAYRYAALPVQATLAVEKVQPRIAVDVLVEARVQPEQLVIDCLAIYDIQRAGVFQLDLDLPAGYQVRQVRGDTSGGVSAVEVDTHHLEGENKTRLVVNLSRKAMGKVALAVQLHKELHEPDLLSPTGKPATIPLDVIRPVSANIERAAGRLVIHAPESLRVNATVSEGLRAISFEEAVQGVQADRSPKDNTRPVLAFAYNQEPVRLELAAERRKPQVTVRQLLVARVEEGVVKYDATFFYSVLYSGIKSLRIDLPAAIAPDVRNQSPQIREKAIEPPPEDLAPDYVAWALTGETELIGEGAVRLTWEKKLEELDVGGSIQLAVPRLEPRGVDRAWGQIVLAKAETIDLQAPEEPKGLRPIDPQHDLMPGAAVKDAARAFEFHDDWTLAVTATRYQLEEIKHTSIERAVVRMVITRAEKIPVQAVYRMRSARQRLVVELPEAATIDAEPRVDGRPTTLEQGQDRQYFIPLVERSADQPFVLELRYTIRGKGQSLELPQFPQDPAVQKVYLCVYLPEEWALLRREGPWTEEFRWHLDDTANWKPASRLSDQDLIAWVSERSDLAQNFPTDGRPYVFSTLSPSPPPAGNLKLDWVEENVLNAIVLGGVILIGLLLIPATAAARVLALGALVIAAVFIGVFYPILAWQILDGVLIASLLVVFVLWTLTYFVWTRPRLGDPDYPPPGPFPAEWPGPVTPVVPPVTAQPQSPPEPERPAEGSSGRDQGGPAHA